MPTPLNVAVIAHVRHAIAPPFMGGMEVHADLVVRQLLANGHRVTLFASADSDAGLPVHAICATGYERELPWAEWRGTPRHRQWLNDAYERCWIAVRAGGFDIVHNNALFPDLHDWALRDRRAMVTSLHIPPFAELADAIGRADAPWLRYTVTSRSQLSSWSQVAEGRTDVAWNGIDLSSWRLHPHGNNRAIWMGRLTPTKGTVEALRACQIAGIGLDIVGPVECDAYFTKVVAALGPDDRYIGHLSGEALANVVGAASVAIATPMWDEPFGLTVVEAMACGVPVAALDRGAMREVIGDAGRIARSVDRLPTAILSALRADRAAQRRRIADHFTASAMVARYESAYAAAMSALDPARASRIANTEALLA